jgi:hypothetical protein
MIDLGVVASLNHLAISTVCCWSQVAIPNQTMKAMTVLLWDTFQQPISL